MTTFIKLPFAGSGDKTAVPDTDASGAVNWTQGYGADYSKDPATDASAKRIEREKFNGLMNAISTAINELQTNGVATFITSANNGGSPFSYKIGDVVNYNGVVYQSLVNTNTTTPAEGTNWRLMTSAGSILGAPKVITASGPYVPGPGVKAILVECVGGGAGGGGAQSANVAAHCIGGSGGAGGTALAFISTLAASYAITIGTGGLGGTIASPTGSDGGTTSFGTDCVATGGIGGGPGNTPAVSTANAIVASGGNPGRGTVGNVRLGSYEAAAVSVGSPYGNVTGNGGSTPYGTGGARVGASGKATTPGNNATGRGAGGSGALSVADSSTSSAGNIGGNGTAGVVLIWEFR